MTEFFDNTEFVSQLGNNVQKSSSMTPIFLAFGIGIAVGLFVYSVYLRSNENFTIKKLRDKDQLSDRDLTLS
jgi:hypothetical protein